MFLRLEGNETEPIGRRIIETPDDAERTEVLRDPRSAFTAYVPIGSVKQGEIVGEYRRQRQDHAVRSVPRGGSERPRTRARTGGPLTELYRAAVVRHAAEGAGWSVDRADAAGCREIDQRRHPGTRRVYCLAYAIGGR